MVIKNAAGYTLLTNYQKFMSTLEVEIMLAITTAIELYLAGFGVGVYRRNLPPPPSFPRHTTFIKNNMIKIKVNGERV